MKLIAALSLVFSLFSSLALGASPHPWPNFRGNSLNNGQSPLPLLETRSPSTRPVTFHTRGIIWGTPVVDASGHVYVGTSAKLFHKLSSNGKELWRYQIKDLPDSLIDSAAALTATGKVIVPGGDGYLHALDQATGRLLWTYGADDADPDQVKTGETVNSFEGNVTVHDGRIYAGCDNGFVYALNDEGKLLWRFQTGFMVWSSPAFSPDGSWMAVGSLDRHLYLLDPVKGTLLAKMKTDGDVKSSPATDGENLYFGTSAEQVFGVKVVKSGSGYSLEKKWVFPTTGEVYSSPALKDGALYFGTLRGYFHAIDAATGKARWLYNARTPIAASPLISSDGAVVFGAKNSKLYALSAETGERIWSYRTSTSLYKANLDSSPSLLRGSDGAVRVAVGSYGGKVFLVPAAYCSSHSSDSSCEIGGKEDQVDHEGPIAADSAELRFVDREGRLLQHSREPISLFEPLQMGLVAYEEGHQVENAAISEFPLKVEVEPKAKLRVVVSSDGTLLNLIPEEALAPGTTYTIKVKGKYYRNTHWLWNRFKWLGLRSFQGNLQVSTDPHSGNLPSGNPTRLWGVDSMYLTQPQALDTYIPAALDGQAFLVSAFGFSPGSDRFLLLAQPALPSLKQPIPLTEPSKSFVLEARSSGRHFVARGSMSIAAMGGAMTFKEAQFSGKLADSGAIERGEFFVNSSCLDIKGNGADYNFPLSLVSWICNAKLHVIGLGPLAGREIKQPPASAALGLQLKLEEDGKTLTLADSGKSLARDRSHLVNLVEYDAGEAKVLRFEAQEIQPACWKESNSCRINLSGKPAPAGAAQAVFVNQDYFPL